MAASECIDSTGREGSGANGVDERVDNHEWRGAFDGLRSEGGVCAVFGGPEEDENKGVGENTSEDTQEHPEVMQPKTLGGVFFIDPALKIIC